MRTNLLVLPNNDVLAVAPCPAYRHFEIWNSHIRMEYYRLEIFSLTVLQGKLLRPFLPTTTPCATPFCRFATGVTWDGSVKLAAFYMQLLINQNFGEIWFFERLTQLSRRWIP